MADDVRRTRFVLSAENKTDRAFRKVRGNFEKTQQAAGNLSRFIGVAFAGLAANSIVRVADEFANLEARINNVTGSTADAKRQFDSLFNIAQETGSSFGDTVEVFQRISLAAKDLGATSDEVAQVVSTVQKLGVVSGASGSALGNALVQLSQGLATGTFRAEEFNSVIENTPAIANAIGKQFGLSAGELRKLVIEGRLSSKAVFEALKNAAQDATDQFAAMPLTVGRAFTQVKNSFGLLISNLDKNAGVVATIGQTFNIFASVISLVAKDLQDADDDIGNSDGISAWATGAATAIAFVVDSIRSASAVLGGVFDVALDALGTGGTQLLRVIQGDYQGALLVGQDFLNRTAETGQQIVGFNARKYRELVEQAIGGIERAAKVSAENVAKTTRKTREELLALLNAGKLDKDAQKAIREQERRLSALQRKAEQAFSGAGRDLETDPTDAVRRVFEERVEAIKALRAELLNQNKLTEESELDLAQKLVAIEEAKNSRINEIVQRQDEEVAKRRKQKEDEALEAARKKIDEQKAYFEEVTGLTSDTIETLFEFQKATLASKAAAIANIFDSLVSSIAASSRKAFKLNKVVAIANAIISTREAIANALAVKPFPLGVALAAVAAARGFAQVRAIKSQQFGGGGSTAPGGGGGAVAAASAAASGASNTTGTDSDASPRQSVSITINGKKFDREDVLELLDGVNEALGDGAQLNIRTA